jgi:phospholipid/cholesterol/gamma-HCH transport system substrate-binding protein
MAIVLFFFGMQYMSGSRIFGDTLRLYAQYNDAQGLIKGNPIMINGLKVGKVSLLQLNLREKKVRVTLDFDDALDIPDNSTAKIVSADLLGSKAVEIVLDSIPSAHYFQDGGEIVGSLEEGFFDTARGLVEDKGTQILIEVARLSEQLNAMISSLRDLLNDENNLNTIAVILANAKSTSANITSISSEIDSLATEINVMASSATRIVKNVEDNNDNVSQIIANVRTTSDSLVNASGRITELVTDARLAMGSVENIANKLNSNEGSLGLLLNDTQLYDSIVTTTYSLNALLEDVKDNPQRYFDDVKLYLIERKRPREKKNP